jgi:hypothetical protein
MFAPLAISKAIPRTTNTWVPDQFANFEEEFQEEEEEEFQEEAELGDYYVGHQESIYTAVPEYTTQDYGYTYDPRLRGVESRPLGGAQPDPTPVLNTIVNPIENLSNRIPLPTVLSPVDMADVAGVGGEDGARGDDAECCGNYIPHFELHQTRENLGMNMAQRARYGTSPGEGVALQHDDERVSAQVYHGPVPVSEPLYTDELYDQGFISMTAVPSVFTGVYTDPITGEEYDAYESGMPPPDADYEEVNNATGRNVRLAHLQGGFRDTTPRPTKTEILEDDFHMTYDRSIGSFGTYDPSYYITNINHNNRFNRDDEHPDADGPVLVGLPANAWGNQGDVKIRPMPYLKPTNRGKWAETTFRAGIDPEAAGGEQRMDYEWTNTSYLRAESSRMDGGGVEAMEGHLGFMEQYGNDGFDRMDTQRSLSQVHMPNMGPAMVDVPAPQVYGEVAAPNHITGTIDSGSYSIGQVTAEHDGPMLQNQLVAAPSNLAGLDVVDHLGAYSFEHDGPKLMNARLEYATSKGGKLTNTQLSMGAGGAYEAQQLDKLVHSAQFKTKREALDRIQTAFNTALDGYTAPQNQATHTRFSDKSGHLTDFVMPGGALNGTESMVSGAQNFGHVTRMSTKREAMLDNQYGVRAVNTDDSTVYGDVRQRMEYVSVRPEGNLYLPVATAGMAVGLRDDRESLGR